MSGRSMQVNGAFHSIEKSRVIKIYIYTVHIYKCLWKILLYISMVSEISLFYISTVSEISLFNMSLESSVFSISIVSEILYVLHIYVKKTIAVDFASSCRTHSTRSVTQNWPLSLCNFCLTSAHTEWSTRLSIWQLTVDRLPSAVHSLLLTCESDMDETTVLKA